MKPILIKSTFALLLLLVGFFIGQAGSNHTRTVIEAEKCNTTDSVSANTRPIERQAVKAEAAQISSIKPTDGDDADMTLRLSDSDAVVRLNALVSVWRSRMTGEYENEIEKMAREDGDAQLRSFAQWILGRSQEAEIDQARQSNIMVTDYQSPDEQIRQSLTWDSYQFQEASDRLNDEQNALDTLYQLSEEEQLEYVNKLVDSQEDAAVNTLEGLVAYYDPTLRDIAINGLLSILASHTGHFDMIVENLDRNSALLNQAQLKKFHELTHPEEKTQAE
jgi:hypothetical protein